MKLGINIDHVATLRQARGTRYPSPIQAALLAEAAGADAITLHLREDRRHIQDRDVEILRELLTTRMNLEMAVTDEMIEIATHIKPHDVCLVPERREELTTEGGLNVTANFEKIRRACHIFKDNGIRVSLFIDAEQEQLESALRAGAPVVEIHTGHYANAPTETAQNQELTRIRQAATLGSSLGLQVNAGHGLDYHNVQQIVRISEIKELNIGHAVVAHALFVGWERAVREMKNAMTAPLS